MVGSIHNAELKPLLLQNHQTCMQSPGVETKYL